MLYSTLSKIGAFLTFAHSGGHYTTYICTQWWTSHKHTDEGGKVCEGRGGAVRKKQETNMALRATSWFMQLLYFSRNKLTMQFKF